MEKDSTLSESVRVITRYLAAFSHVCGTAKSWRVLAATVPMFSFPVRFSLVFAQNCSFSSVLVLSYLKLLTCQTTIQLSEHSNS